LSVYIYGGRAAEIWWEANAKDLAKQQKLSVYVVDEATSQALAALAERTMVLQATIQDGELWLSNASGASVTVKVEKRQ
jgi:uncharacterized protein YaeQ